MCDLVFSPRAPDGVHYTNAADLRASGFDVRREDYIDPDEWTEEADRYCFCSWDIVAILDRSGFDWDEDPTGWHIIYDSKTTPPASEDFKRHGDE